MRPNFCNSLRWSTVIRVLAVVALLLTAALAIARSSGYMRNGDFFSFWLSARMMWTGEDPYSEAQWVAGHTLNGAEWISDQKYLYPLTLALFLAPVGVVPLEVAAVVWVFLSLLALLGSTGVVLSSWGTYNIRYYLLPVIAGVLLFRPAIVTMMNGQLGAILLLVALLAAYLCQRGKWLAGGLAFSILMLKPQIGVPLIVIMAIWSLLNKRWRLLLGVGLGGFILFALGTFQDPFWLQKFLLIGSRKLEGTFGYSPTLWGIGAMICRFNQQCGLRVGILLNALFAIGLTALFILRLSRVGPLVALAWASPATLLMTPYLWAYDQILLLLPILVSITIMIKREIPYLITATTPLLFSAAAISLVLISMRVGHDIWSGLLSFVCLVLITSLSGFTKSQPSIELAQMEMTPNHHSREDSWTGSMPIN